MGSSLVAETLDLAPVSSNDFLDIQANIECRLTLKWVRVMIKTNSQIFVTNSTQTTGIIWKICK